MRNMRRFIAILAPVSALSIAAVILTTHAADQGTQTAGAQPARGMPPLTAQRSNISPTPAAPTTSNPSVTTTPAPGAPQVPEESATIRDDATIVPDPKQSADKDVSFPNDT
jgi:hypothetical protein